MRLLGRRCGGGRDRGQRCRDQNLAVSRTTKLNPPDPTSG
jgi:hypothetical protein